MADSDASLLEETICCECGVSFALPKSFVAIRRKTGGNFWCPNGHSLKFNNSVESRIAEITKERDHWQKEAERLLEERDKLIGATAPKVPWFKGF